MMLADPGRVEADFLGPQRLGVDVLDEVLVRARIVGIAVVAQREVTELHGVSSRLAAKVRRFRLFVNANKRTSRGFGGERSDVQATGGSTSATEQCQGRKTWSLM